MSLNQEIKEATGNVENHYGIGVNKFRINFSKGVSKFEKYDTISENKKLKIFSNFYFPMELCKTTYQEVTMKQVNYTEEQAKEILVTKLEEELKIVNTQINQKLDGEVLEVEVIYEVLENIGTNEKIVF